MEFDFKGKKVLLIKYMKKEIKFFKKRHNSICDGSYFSSFTTLSN